MDPFNTYKKNIMKRLRKRWEADNLLLVHLPYSLNQFTFFNNTKLRIIDFRKYLFRYSTNTLYILVNKISKIIGKKETLLNGLDLVYRFYPRNKNIVFRILENVIDRKAIAIFNDLEVLTLVSRHFKLDFMEIEETSLSMLWELIPRERYLNISEGSPTAYESLLKENDIVFENILYRYLFKDSNLRFLLYYFTFYRGVSNIARILGSQIGTYVNRLIKRGIVMRVGRRRAVYLIRDPLIRIFFTRIYNKGEDWYYAGFQYIIRKLFEGIRRVYSISTLEDRIYVGEAARFQLINEYSFRMKDRDNIKYFIGIGYNPDKVIELSHRYNRDKKIIILKETPDIKTRKRLKKEGFKVVTLQSLEYMAKEIGFARVI